MSELCTHKQGRHVKVLRIPSRLGRLALLPLAILTLAAFAPTIYASGPNSGPQGQPHGDATKQDPQWLKAKSEYRVSSGIVPGQGKGASTHATVLSTPFFNPSVKGGSVAPYTGAPSSYTLAFSGTGVQWAAEPGDGKHYNFPESNWQFTYDDAYHHYADGLMYTLCGPGAVDVATFYWPAPPNYANYANVVDPLNPTQATSWNGTDVDGTTRMRGYMVHLAYQIHPPTWNQYGMLSQSYYQSGEFGGSTLQVVRDALNWEASGENPSNWSSYFYVNVWNYDYTSESQVESALHSDIVADLYYNHVPVIVETEAGYLTSNWPSGDTVYHFVAIIGYDDIAGTYTYIDTCKYYTACDPRSADTPDDHKVSQHSLAQGVYSIPSNQATGDGGWVW